ncbi:protein THEMIS2 [Pygocentrus nattereri]|uniref:protein THEMIS2 n=1 Tax=Pygocentrus nattereri TaxID=42514 RepID=UPI0008149607|nr:protein THEMIS2 [Pygocentrus nattereri]
MGDPGVVLDLREYISSLDRSSLPRILQVCSGVYFQGSVYELSGSEVCLSTGDLVKVTGLELLSVCCEDIGNNTTFELPLEHSGLFKLVPEDLPYSTIEELVGLQPVGVDACGSFTFISRNELIIDNLTVPAGKEITLLSVEVTENEERRARCQLMGQQGVFADMLIPFSYHGEFYECENDRGYSLQEIMMSDRLCRRRFRKIKSKKCGGPLLFVPIYQIQGIMHMRKNIVKFPSSLEVDVIDVTEQCKDLTFVTPLLLAEIATQPKTTFPTMAEILEAPEANRFFCCSWFTELKKGKHLVLHKRDNTAMVLACTPRGRKAQQYFLISHDYGGQMRRRPREFSSVYELYVAFSRCPGLKVRVTRHCEAVEEEGVPALSVDEQLEVLKLQTVEMSGGDSGPEQKLESLICRRIIEEDEDDDEMDENQEESEEICLPLFTQAHFVEKLPDKKKYCLADLVKNFSLPLEVKVVSCDKDLEKDPLVGLTAVVLEEALEETTVLASLPDSPERCFALPTRWLQMSLCFISDPLPWAEGQTPELHPETVSEVTDHFYHEYHRLTQTDMAPPPRPPKRKPSSSESQKTRDKPKSRTAKKKSSNLPEKLDSLSLDHTKPAHCKRNPPPPPPLESTEEPPPVIPRKSVSENLTTANTYVQTPRKQQKKQRHTERTSSGSDHDYETVDDVIQVPDSIMFY